MTSHIASDRRIVVPLVLALVLGLLAPQAASAEDQDPVAATETAPAAGEPERDGPELDAESDGAAAEDAHDDAAAYDGPTVSATVRWRAGVDADEQAAALASVQAVETGTVPALRLATVDIPEDDAEAVVAALTADGGVESAELDVVREIETAPSDPRYGDQWALQLIGWEAAREATAVDGAATIAVLDTGVEAGHPDLAGRVRDGYAAVDGAVATSDPNGHGTAIAAIAAAGVDDGVGIAGVAFAGVDVLPVTVLGEDGLGWDSDVIEGVVWAADNGADVILMSFSNPGYSDHLQYAVDYAWSKGAVVVAASGNDGSADASYPAGLAKVVGVSGTTQDDGFWTGSNHGSSALLAAPAVDVANGSGSSTGTSASAAIVAGAAAVAKAADGDASNGTIVGRLARNAEAVGTTDQTGNGRLDLARTLADTSTEPVVPAAASPQGDGGPVVGPYEAAQVGRVTIGTQTPSPVAPGGSASFEISATKTGGNNETITLSTPSLPLGVTATWEPNDAQNFTSPGAMTRTLTLSVAPSVAAGSYEFQVRGTGESGQPANATGTLVVASSVALTELTLGSGSGSFGASTSLAARLTTGGSAGVAGKDVAFAIDGDEVGTATTDADGIATLEDVYLDGLDAGEYEITASFAGDATHEASQGSNTLTIEKAEQAELVVTGPEIGVFGEVLTPTASGGSGTGDVVFDAAGDACEIIVDGDDAGHLRITRGTGDCTLTATKAGDTNHLETTSAAFDVEVGRAEATLTLNGLSATYDGASHPITVTTEPAGLDGVSVTYDEASAAPVDAGTYDVVAMLDHPDYVAEAATGELTIARRALEVIPADATKTYGEGDPELKFTVTGGDLVGDDGFDGSLTRDAGEDVGTYAIRRGGLTAGPNYSLTVLEAELEIIQRSLEVTADAKFKTFGDSDPALTYRITDGSLAFEDGLIGELEREEGEDAGTYTINRGSLTISSNYALTYVGADLTVSKRLITVVADPQVKVYGEEDPALTYEVEGDLQGDDGFSGALARETGEDVGTYTIGQGDLALSSNYRLDVQGADLVVTARPITVTADDQSKTYGASDPELTYRITAGSLAFSDVFDGDLEREAGDRVGGYAISQGTFGLSGNYDITFLGGTLTIGARAITVTADPQTKVYGDEDPALTYQVTGGEVVEGDEFTGGLERGPGQNVGTYTIGAGDLALTSDYELTVNGAELEITPRRLEVTADPQTKVYGDADPSLTYRITDGALVGTDVVTGALTRVAGEDVGTYAVGRGALTAGSNYDLSFVGADLEITPRPITVTAHDASKVYGDSDPAFRYSLSEELVGEDEVTGALSRAAGEDVGAYAIEQGTLELSTNYDPTFDGARLTIHARSLEVTADEQTKTYGDDDPDLSYEVTDGALVEGDSVTGALTREAGHDVGTYRIQQGSLTAGDNYDLSFIPADLEITPRSVTVTAVAMGKTYGDHEPDLNYSTDGDLAFGDAFTGVLQREPGEAAGTYAIEQGSLELSENYTLTFVGADFTIAKRAIEVTADAKTKVYGEEDPTPTYDITSGELAFDDGFTGALSRQPGEDVGAYAIEQGTLALSADYDLSYEGADLTITRRTVEVTADAKSKVYGASEPLLTYQITAGSLAFSDEFSGELTRVPGRDVGSYAIEQGTLALADNYVLTYVGAALSITPRPVTVTADARSKVYGEDDPTLSYQITAGDLVFDEEFSGALAREAGKDVGAYAVTQGTLALSSNYALTYEGTQLTITQRPVTVTADAETKVYGEDDPALTYVVTSGSLVEGDGFSGALARDGTEDVGAYAISQGTLALSTNYDLSFVAGTFEITARPVTVTADDQSKTYGDAEPALTYKVTSGSLAFSDAFTGELARASGERVGDYPITQGTLALSTNYELTFVGGTLTIGPRAITVTVDDQSKTYGDGDPTLSYEVTSGSLVEGDRFRGAPERDGGEDVGTYAITEGTLALPDDYTLVVQPGTLTITKRPITVTADARTKVYGEADPGLTFKVTGGSLVGGHEFDGALTRADGEDVGEYAIGRGDLSAGGNYDLSFVGAELTISKRPITVTARAQTKVYGDADPALTYNISEGELVPGDAFTGALVRVAGEDVGTYAIEQDSLTVGGNYALSFVGADLTITQRPIQVTADPQTKTAGTADPVLTHQVTDGELVGDDEFSGELTRESGERVGTYRIEQGTLALSANYDLVVLGADFTITTGYRFEGFFKPVDMTPDGAKRKVNVVKGGSTVPLKFQLFSTVDGAEITSTDEVELVGWTRVGCDADAEVEEMQEVAATGATVLRYTGGQFVFNWSVPKKAGECYRIAIRTSDGQHHQSAFFQTR